MQSPVETIIPSSKHTLQDPQRVVSAMSILEVDQLTAHYDGIVALDNVSFSFPLGERIAVVGPNGAGKSTLFKAMAGLLTPTRGTVRIAGHPLRRSTDIAHIPQRSVVDWTFPVSVADVVMMGRTRKLGLLRWPRARDREVVQNSLAMVHMTDLAKRQIGELSGGQQQRVFIARALAQEATLMLMDEPLTGLDITSQEEILTIIAELKDRGVTVLVATHDLNQAADSQHYEAVVLLNKELVGVGKAQDVLTPERLTRAYGGQLRWITTNQGTMILADSCCGHGNHH
ncbi:MAG: hypothetical protein GFH27_549281n131 [Chloroflexi bacterium AL-W]|nr:hypothetical protein [Chloroflexi bacterium AL-N1]NOK66017.1 hypothetical protein [Chloroflexi bacterium AL-N10]NOK72898.1 hypothetical protein [Chloroflexi bacterium AL-N5]NOK79795.1 hypothetical protein [Chloroflexi bacterium AL-W]NOK88349.1 hypothetical protein [Chloroflexi bacterium AL-N15]